MITNQKVAVLEYLETKRSHPTVEEIFFNVQKRLPRISRGTVYRNLETLKEEGTVREVSAPGATRFESIRGCKDHHHFMCTECGSITDFQSRILNKRILTFLRQYHPEFVADDTMIGVKGICTSCKKTRRKIK